MVYVNASISVQKTASNLGICYLRLGDCIFMFSCSVYSHKYKFSPFLYYRPLLCDSCCHHSVDSISSSFYRLSRQQINQQVDIFYFWSCECRINTVSVTDSNVDAVTLTIKIISVPPLYVS